MNDEEFDFAPEDHWLTRSEAARYVGVAGESAIRAAEAKGLHGVRDPNGQVWHTPEALDAWTWRGKPPTAVQKTRILKEARKAREQEARARDLREQQEARRAGAEAEAELTRLNRVWDAEDALKAKVERRAEEIRAEFKRNYMNERMAGAVLGFKSWEAGRKLGELVECGLLRPFGAPHEPTIVMSMDGWREGEGPSLLQWEAPFFLREEILALRRGAAEVARETLAQAPAPVRAQARATPTSELSAEFLEWLTEQLQKRGKGGDP
jgi:hypothetical protein